LLDDLRGGLLLEPVGSGDDLTALVRERCPEVMDGADWRAIDRWERQEGRAAGRPRVKVVDAEAAVNIARTASLPGVPG
jgi:ferredoxin--NADP+ reductase